MKPKFLLMSLVLGILSGLVTVVYFKGLIWIQNFHTQTNLYIYLLPVAWLVLMLFKRQTLYFPTSVAEVVDPDEVRFRHWNKLMLPFNLFGTWLGHFAGVAVGREGTNVVLSASLINLLEFDWKYWRPIALSVGFSAAVGNPWISVVFLIEMFSTDLHQKLWTVLAAWTACLLTQTLGISPLLPDILILNQETFFSKIALAVAIGASLGVMARFYKFFYPRLKNFFIYKYIWAGFIAVVLLTVILSLPEFHKFHSLSLPELTAIMNGTTTLHFVGFKFLFLLFFVSLGFWGGEFIPAVLIGSALGVLIAKLMNIDFQMGFLLGTFGLFCGLTRLKWTSMILAASIVAGWEHLIWIYFTYSTVAAVCGEGNVYEEIT